MSLRHRTGRADSSEKREQTSELSGKDAPKVEAQQGDAGSGASAFGADTTGLPSPAPEYEEQFGLEANPSHPEDILPDEIVDDPNEAFAVAEQLRRRKPPSPSSETSRAAEPKD